MAIKEFLKGLFDAHSFDLSSVTLREDATFICPICFSEHSKDAIDNNILDDGHVWPKYIREKSKGEAALHQRVLFCKDCNSNAGSHGDKQMQLREKIKDGEKSGQFYDERRIQIITTPDEDPIKLRAKFCMQEKEIIEGEITFEVAKRTGRWIRNNPMEQERFKAATQNERVSSLLVEPSHELRSELSPVGWVTSAYLLAFYTFGYRYVLHKGLDTVRNYIMKSFDDNENKSLETPTLPNFGLTEYKKHYFENPEIAVVIPMDGITPVHLRVSFLDYHVRLPFHFVPHLLQAQIPNIHSVAKQLPNEAELYIPVLCNKLNGHDCKWDYILEKPIPYQ